MIKSGYALRFRLMLITMLPAYQAAVPLASRPILEGRTADISSKQPPPALYVTIEDAASCFIFT